MLAVQTAVSFLSRIAPTLAPTLAPRIGLPVESVGYLSALITGGSLVPLLLGLPLLRRLGSMRNLQVGLSLGVLGALLSAVPAPAALLFGSLLIGISIGPPSSAGMDVLQRFAPPRHRNLLFSVKQAGVPLGGVLAGLLMPWASQALGITAAVVIAAAIGAVTLLAVQPLRERVDAAREHTLALDWRMFLSPNNLLKPMAVLVAMPALRRMGLAGGCLGAGQSAWFAFLVTYLVVELRWTLTAAGALFALMQGVGVLGRPLAGFISDRLGDGKRVLRWAAIGSGLTTLALACCTPAWPAWSVVALAALAGLTVASWNGVQFAEVARMAPRETLNETMTGATLLLLLAYVVGPALFSLVVAAGASFGAAFAATALVTFSALIPLARVDAPAPLPR
ncbi:MAG: MFS transporter [Aquabacterium sp.]|nr:MFS transporter [Aquabacterium sp.]